MVRLQRRVACPPRAGLAGLDLTEHGMYGYPEQLLSATELTVVASRPPSRRFARNGAARASEEETVAT